MARNFTITDEFLGYQTRSNILNSDPRFLAAGSQNMLVDWNASLVQRGGVELVGAEGETGNGVIGAYTWRTSRGIVHTLRVWGTKIQRLKMVVVGETVVESWEDVASSFDVANSFVSFTPIVDHLKGKEYLIISNGRQYIYYWGGAYATVASADVSSVTISGIRSLIDLGFDPNPPALGYSIKVSSGGTFTYTSLIPADATNEVVKNCTFDYTIDTGIINASSHGLQTNSIIKFTTTGTLPTGLNTTSFYFPIEVTNDTFKVSLNPDGGPVTFTNNGTGTHTINLYTGELNTFNGVTFSAATPVEGDSLMEGVFGQLNDSMAFSPEFTVDVVGTYHNQLHLGCVKDRRVYISHASDEGSYDYSFLNYVTSLEPGGPRQLTLDDTCQQFVANKDVMLSFGASESIIKLTSTLSADQSKEYREEERLETATLQGLMGPNLAIKVKNAIIYITKEKTLDTIEFIENIADIQSIPISDIIKSDFEAADFTGASIYYWKRNLLIATPASSKVFMYDLQRKLWQAPMVFTGITIGLFSTDENGELLGHDYFKNESYRMFTGYSDNGSAIHSIATFSYNFFGSRYQAKRFTQYIQDGFITSGGVLTRTLKYDYKGQTQLLTTTFSGGDRNFAYFEPNNVPLGASPLGQNSLSGASLAEVDDQRRFLYSDSVPPTEFEVLEVTYEMNVDGNSWRLLAHGADIEATGSDNNKNVRNMSNT